MSAIIFVECIRTVNFPFVSAIGATRHGVVAEGLVVALVVECPFYQAFFCVLILHLIVIECR